MVLAIAALLVTRAYAGIVTICDQADLVSALSAGGTVSFGCDGSIVLNQTLAIAQDTVLDGTGHAVTISGNNAVRVFHVNPGVHFTLKNLAVANGSYVGTNATASGAQGETSTGGGIYNDGGIVEAVNCQFSGNSAVGGAGGPNGGNGGPAQGGAIYNNAGTLNLTNSIFSANTLTGGAAAVGSPSGGAALGAGIRNAGGTVNLDGCSFLQNNGIGGASDPLSFGGPQTAGGAALGGGLSTTAGVVTVVNCVFSNSVLSVPLVGNRSDGTNAPAAGAGIYQDSGTLRLISSTFVANAVTGGGFSYYYGSPGPGNGGAVFNGGSLNCTNCTFLGNHAYGGFYGQVASAGNGGALCNAGSAFVSASTFIGNSATGGMGNTSLGGATPSGPGNGGGIFNGGVLTLLNTTLSGNAAAGGSGAAAFLSSVGQGANGYGGGLYNAGTLLATNDTFYANSANGGAGGAGTSISVSGAGGNGYGGGLYLAGGSAWLVNQTVAANAANGGASQTGTVGSGFGGGIDIAGAGLGTALNSILAGNGTAGNVFGSLVDGGYNMSTDATGQFSAPGSLNNTDPKLGALGNFGGPTQTVPLLTGSPAIDAVPAASAPSLDQRGFARPYGPAADMGAFEATPIFAISGQVSGYLLPSGITVTIGTAGVTPDATGRYSTNGLLPGTFAVTPSATGMFFVPPSQTITVGPSTNNVNFRAYRLNAASVEGYSNAVLHLTFAGTNGQPQVIETSSNLVNWVPVLTNYIGGNGLLDFFATNALGQTGRFFRTRTP